VAPFGRQAEAAAPDVAAEVAPFGRQAETAAPDVAAGVAPFGLPEAAPGLAVPAA
jgi:hypothetical protein